MNDEFKDQIVLAIFDATLESDVLGDRLLLNKVFLQLVPMKICSLSNITTACESFFEFFVDTLVDFPKATDYFRDLLSGTIVGYESKRDGAPKGIIAPALLPTILAEKMDVKKPVTAASVPAPTPAPIPAPAPLPAPVPVIKAPSTSSIPEDMMDTPTAASLDTPIPEVTKADIIADELEEVDLFAMAKKKKKAAKKAVTEE